MGDWKTDIRSQLVDVRGADSSQRLALLNEELIRLSTTHALSRATYRELQRLSLIHISEPTRPY